MQQQVDQTPNGGNQTFDFNRWINSNDLNDVKHLFVRHGATTQSSLKFLSPQIQNFMIDPEVLSRAQRLPQIMNALHNVNATVITIVLSEAEEAVIQGIKLKLKAVDKMEEDVNRLKSEYPRSQQRVENMKTKEIESVKAQINNTFEQIFAALNRRKQSLLNQLNVITLKAEQDDDSKQNNEDDQKVDPLTECSEYINDLKQFLIGKKEEYNTLISVEMSKSERKSKILEIGRQVDSEFASTKVLVRKHSKTVKKKITKNELAEFTLDFNCNEGVYSVLLSTIGTLGVINRWDGPIRFKWVAQSPPNYENKYYYEIEDECQSIRKTKNNRYVIMARSDPWFRKHGKGPRTVKAHIRVDQVTNDLEDNYAVGVITRKFWNTKCHVGNSSHLGVHNWRFTGGIYVGNQKQQDMPRIDNSNQLIGVEIDFARCIVKYELWQRRRLNFNIVATAQGKFDALEDEEVCIAVSVRKTGWKFTFVSKEWLKPRPYERTGFT